MKFLIFTIVVLSMIAGCYCKIWPVETGDNFFNPVILTINAGDSVSWTWNTTNDHNVAQVRTSTSTTPLNGGFFSGDPVLIGTFTVSFPSAGTYDYICVPHIDNNMRGSIIVKSHSSDSTSLFVSQFLLSIFALFFIFF